MQNKVLMIYTGGTIGMLPKDKDDPKSPLVPVPWEKIKGHSSAFKRLQFDVEIREMTLIDSSNMNPKYWIDIAEVIRDCYDEYKGFVVLHGTDTMAYTATALSFLLENLSKPVIVTGSQLPLADARNDASQNMVTALTIAASVEIPTIPEVCILFDNVLLRGNRSCKVSSTGFAGFDSPDFEPLAKIGENIEVNEKIIQDIPKENFCLNNRLCEDVVILTVFPGIKPCILRAIFNIERLKGVVIQTFGTGNASTDPNFLDEIKYAVDVKGLAVVNVTQCIQGMVEMGLYDTSTELLRLGVISGVDMTMETALIKMMFLLGQECPDEDYVKNQMQKNLRGEQSFNVFNLTYSNGNTTNGCFQLKFQQLPAGFLKEMVSTVNIRFYGIKSENEEKLFKLKMFMNDANASDSERCLGIVEKQYEEDKTDFSLRCTDKVRQLMSNHGQVQLTVVSEKGEVSWDGIVFSIYTNVK